MAGADVDNICELFFSSLSKVLLTIFFFLLANFDCHRMAVDIDAEEFARLSSLPVPPPPSWTLGDSVPKVVAALDVAWGKSKHAETGEEEEVAVACCVAFDLASFAAADGAHPPPPPPAPLFVEFEPQQGLLRGPFPPYESGKLFNREGPRLLVPLVKRVIGGRGGERENEDAADAADADDVEKAKEVEPEPFPEIDLFLVDGFGELHPQRFGSACALGVAVGGGGVATTGVAKSMLFLGGEAGGGALSPSEREARKGGGGLESRGMRPFLCPSARGMETWFLGDDGGGNPLAVAMRPEGRRGGEEVEVEVEVETSSAFSSLPGRAAFVSAGYRCPLSAAARAVLACYDPRRRFRLPEPSRAADRFARERLRRELAKVEEAG